MGLKDRINLLLKDKIGLRTCKMCQKPPNNLNDRGLSEHRVCDCGYILCCECRDVLNKRNQLCCPSCNIQIMEKQAPNNNVASIESV